MNKRRGGNQTGLAIMAGIVMGVLILIAVLAARERQGIVPTDTSPARGPAPEDFVPTGTSPAMGLAPEDLLPIGTSPARGLAPEDFVPSQADSARVRALLAQARPTATPVVERSYDIARAQIVEDVIVHLERMEVTNKGMRIEYALEHFEQPQSFFRSLFNRKDAAIMEIGTPNIRFPDGHISVSDGYDVESDSEVISFFEDGRTPLAGEVVTVSMGSYIISASELGGSVTIALPTRYGDFEPGQEVKTGAHMVIEDAQYAVSLKRTKFSTRKHRVILTPVNYAAERTQLIFGEDQVEDRPGVDVQGAVLAVASSRVLNFYSKVTNYRDDLDSRLIESMVFGFAGYISPDATSMTFSVQDDDGGRIRGPFIFEDVRLVAK